MGWGRKRVEEERSDIQGEGKDARGSKKRTDRPSDSGEVMFNESATVFSINLNLTASNGFKSPRHVPCL